jgi:putative oxidoreductase
LLKGSVFQTVCGVALIVGFYPAWAALGLILFGGLRIAAAYSW